MSNITKTAMITVCGRPNVGKSSLTNALVGEKVAIVSNKAQTTRNRIYGIVNREDTQYILLDTPGLHKPKSALEDYMVTDIASGTAAYADACVRLTQSINDCARICRAAGADQVRLMALGAGQELLVGPRL